MKPKKRKAGRPRLPKDQVKNVVAVRLSESERNEYERRAAGAGLKLSDWIRQVSANKFLLVEQTALRRASTGRSN